MKEVKSIALTEAPSQGRTLLSEQGRPVSVVYDANRDAFFEYITGLAKLAKND